MPDRSVARGRQTGPIASWLLVVLATLLAFGASVSLWASGLADADTFAAQATEALNQDDVSQLVAERLVDRFAGDTVLGTAGRPVAVGLTRGVLTSDEFAGVFQASVRTAHEQLVSDRDDSVTVALAGAAPVIGPAVDPSGTSDPTDAGSAVVAVVDNPVLVSIAHLLSVMDTVFWACASGWLLLSALALLLAPDRRRALRRLGAGLLVAGVVLAGAVMTARAVVGLGEPADVHAAAADLVTVFTQSLLRLAAVLVAVGGVLAVAALRTPPTAAELARAAADRAREMWRHPVVRAGSPVLALVGGLAIFLDPMGAIAVLTQVLGLALVVGGAVVLLGGLSRALDRGRPTAEQPGTARSMGVFALVVTIVVAVTAGLAVAAITTSSDSPAVAADPDGQGCNGLVGLCDRRLDQVALAGTHNSMSSTAERDWFLGEQRLSISGQLAYGVRALMLDVYPGYVSEGHVRTDLRAPRTAEAAAADVTEEGRAALEHLGLTVGAIPPEDATIEAYLCHAYCELGASLMVDKLRDIGDFLAHNPNEVMVIVLQDYLNGEQIQEVFEEAGLLERVWQLTAQGPWPTLRQMVLEERNIVVLSENHGGEVPWMPAAYDVMEETPYEFASPEDFTCVPGRGGTGKPLFLVNHWIRESGRDPLADAELVNSKDVLDERLATCRRERDRDPGILAVDFVDVGDVLAVIGDLNSSIATP